MDKATNPQTPCDAFAYWPLLRGFPRYLEMSVQQLDPLRRANTFRPRMVVVPDVSTLSGNVFIPAYGRYQYQFRVPCGSWIWAFLQVGSGLLFSVRSSCNDMPLSKDFISINAGSPAYPMVVLPQPIVVVGDGLVDIDVANTNSTDVTTLDNQILIFVAEAPDYNAELMPGVSMPKS